MIEKRDRHDAEIANDEVPAHRGIEPVPFFHPNNVRLLAGASN
jgi:hypothetical protein